MRPGPPRSNADLAWLFALLPLAMFGGLALWWANAGGACDSAPCDAPLQVDIAVWTLGVALALAALWLPRPRPLLAAATLALTGVVVHFVVVVSF
jgi:hypothetical protein